MQPGALETKEVSTTPPHKIKQNQIKVNKTRKEEEEQKLFEKREGGTNPRVATGALMAIDCSEMFRFPVAAMVRQATSAIKSPVTAM